MPSARAIKARNRQYYNSYAEGIRSRKRDNYQNNPQYKKDASRASYKADPNKAKETARKQYNNNPELQKKASHDRYRTHSETIKEDARKQYKSNPEPKRGIVRKRYRINPEPKRRIARKRYRINPEPKRRIASKRYWINPELKRRTARKRYSATSRMLVKASESDVSGFQAFTVRNLDNKLSTDTDIEQYKLLNVREDPISNRQEHLDVMCFPTLFPTGKFGKNHPREVKISHSEYDKSRLLNKDSRFRKHAPYVFYLLWQKEMRELSAGVYNLMKNSNRIHQMTASSLLSNVQNNDEHLEANLCTMLQSVRGSQQYWFVRKSELKCMIREYGSPTFFLTFSCAEYESADIANYLRKLNDVPPTYNIGKLCTEDPISVSRKFSLKFHAFFKTVLLKGEVLGTVEHFYWKKEYQARGAPHYHVLLWIKDAPVIGRDDPDVVLSWMQERITCNIPNKQSDSELHSLVTRYQLHKCSRYCKRRRKCGNTYITRCRFAFPRQPCETAKLNPVSDSLKSRSRIYQLKRSESETRVNDYNPLLLLLWKANIDIQFVAESSLALAHYVIGYVTKAEKSSMQELWQQISDNKSIYGRLWSFGVRSLRFRECGLYEASDLLLGDHLTEKSTTVKWIDVSMPQNRQHQLKDHRLLKDMAIHDPDSDDIFEKGLLDKHYPNRPA